MTFGDKTEFLTFMIVNLWKKHSMDRANVAFVNIIVSSEGRTGVKVFLSLSQDNPALTWLRLAIKHSNGEPTVLTPIAYESFA